jgi:trimeric autotransporter adhesin
MRFITITLFCIGLISWTWAQTSPPSSVFQIRGVVKSGNTPLPGVTISASNTLTGKKIVTSTDAQGVYSIQAASRGRYVIKTDFPAFASSTKEAVLNPTTPTATVDLELVLLSRVPKTSEQPDGMQVAGVINGQGTHSTTLNSTGMQGEATALEMPSDAPALANSADAGNQSISFAGASGRTQDFGRNIEDIRDRIEEMRERGELGSPGDMVIMGGPGGPGGGAGVMVFSGPGGGGGGGGVFQQRISGRFKPNRPHGSVFFSTGNAALDAAPYSLSGAPGEKPDYSSYRFGGTIGGPLPKRIDASQKTFVFLNFFGTRSTQPYQAFSHVPTALERSGDFSQTLLPNGLPVQIVDPSTGQLTNKLSTIDPTAAALLNYIPLPNQPGEQNFRFTDAADNNGTNIGIRLMRSIGSSSAPVGPRRGPFGRNNVNFGLNYNSNSTDLLRPFASTKGSTNFTGLNTNAGYTFSRGKWTNNLRANYNHSKTDTRNLYAGVTDIEGRLGITGVSQDSRSWGLPGLSFTNYAGLTDVTPVSRDDNVFQISDAIILRHGKHNVRFGGDFRHLWTGLRSNPNPRGTFVFTGLATSLNATTGTGYDLADFLSGIPQQTSIQYSPASYSFSANGWNLFVNDDWRIGANLTLNLGLRYEYVGPYVEAENRLVNLDAAQGFTAVTPIQPGQTGPYNGVFPDSLVRPDRNNWAPRIGIAWKPFSKTVVRAGYGINYNLGQYRSIVEQLAFQPPFSFTQTNLLSATTPLTLQDGFPASTASVTNNYGIDLDYKLAYVQMWNLNVQHELPWDLLLNVGYTGSKGTGLDIVGAPNRGPSGLLIPGVQPFLWESSDGSSILHSGNVRLRKRFSRGVSFGATYTFAKSIDNASSIGGGATVVAQNENDLAAERGLSSFDQRHRLTGDFVLDLPFGKNRKWLSHGGIWERIFGAWQWSGTYSIASGTPFTARVLGSFEDVARGTDGTLRADVTGQPLAIDDPTVLQWFNTTAFTIPPTGQFGTAGRNTIIGPTTWNFGMALSKTFQFKDTMGLEIRAEATNVFNTPQFTLIDTVVNSPTYGQVIGVGSTRRVQLSARYRF